MNKDESTRQLKVGRLVQKEIGSLFLKELSQLVAGVVATVTRVRVSPDLSHAKVYMSIFPFNKSEEVMKTISAASSQVRFLLGREVKNQLRIVPQLVFFLDDSMEYIDNIDTLLQK